MLARLIAIGKGQLDAARLCGYSYTRVNILCNDPAFKELVAHYRTLITQGFMQQVEGFAELAISNMLKAERQISDRLDQADKDEETLPVKELIAISRDAADRFGFGKKQTNVNVNVDFAARLEAAIKRSKVIDGEVVLTPSLSQSGVGEGSSKPPSPSLAPAPFPTVGSSSRRLEPHRFVENAEGSEAVGQRIRRRA